MQVDFLALTFVKEQDDALKKDRFLATKLRVDEHNEKFRRGAVSYLVDVNKFATWVLIVYPIFIFLLKYCVCENFLVKVPLL